MDVVRSLRAVVLLLAVAVAGAAFAAPASAHAQWLGSDPEEGAVLPELPAAVVMTYSEDIAPEFVDTALVPPGGEAIPTEGTADGVDVVVDLAGSADVAAVADQAGEWQLVARVVSADGHPVEHTTMFEVEAAAEPSAVAPAPSTAQPSPAEPSVAEPSVAEPSVAAPSVAEPSVAASAAAEPSVGQPATEPADEATAISSDPMAGVADGLPGWAVPLVVLALLGAGAAAVVVHLRRPPPEV